MANSQGPEAYFKFLREAQQYWILDELLAQSSSVSTIHEDCYIPFRNAVSWEVRFLAVAVIKDIVGKINVEEK